MPRRKPHYSVGDRVIDRETAEAGIVVKMPRDLAREHPQLVVVLFDGTEDGVVYHQADLKLIARRQSSPRFMKKIKPTDIPEELIEQLSDRLGVDTASATDLLVILLQRHGRHRHRLRRRAIFRQNPARYRAGASRPLRTAKFAAPSLTLSEQRKNDNVGKHHRRNLALQRRMHLNALMAPSGDTPAI
jgi:hypothetical protein